MLLSRNIATTALLLSCSFVNGKQTQVCEVGEDGMSVCVAEEATEAKEEPTHHLPCGVYMAPSTLGEDTNMGIYTGIDLPKDSVMNYPEIAIPLMFREWDGHPFHDIDDGTLWDRYIWEGEVANLESVVDTDRIRSRAVFVPGVGCTINGVMDMNNIESTHGSTYDTNGITRSRSALELQLEKALPGEFEESPKIADHPGTGAFCPYHESKSTTVEDVPAGSEIFASYGDTWIPQIPGAQITSEAVLLESEEFLRDVYYPFVKQNMMNKQSNKEAAEALAKIKEGLYSFTRDFPFYSQVFTNLPRKAKWEQIEDYIAWSQDTYKKDEYNQYFKDDQFKTDQRDLLHTDAEDTIDDEDPNSAPVTSEEDAEEEGFAPMHRRSYSVIRHFMRTQAMRSIEWLQKHGKCQDHIKPGPSSVSQAGWGAFAARDLPKGTVVGYSPLIHIGTVEKTLWNLTHIHHDLFQRNGYNYFDDLVQTFETNKRIMEKGEPDMFDDLPTTNRYNQLWDLIINYSFGHKDSTLILTPYGAMVNYINHHKTDANVEVQWPNEELIAHKPNWLVDKTVEDLHETIDKIGLSFDYVATRDIKKGEEIFLDYGEEWQEAWDDHVANWENSIPEAFKHEFYVHTADWDHGVEYYKTLEEQEEEPYPDNFVFMCKKSYRLKRGRNAGDEEYYTYVKRRHPTPRRVYCTILERDDSSKFTPGATVYTYTVEMSVMSRKRDTRRNEYYGDEEDDEEEEEDDSDMQTDIIEVRNVPQDEIDIFDKAKSQDFHLPFAFRHKIAIPDHIFPEQWKNLK